MFTPNAHQIPRLTNNCVRRQTLTLTLVQGVPGNFWRRRCTRCSRQKQRMAELQQAPEGMFEGGNVRAAQAGGNLGLRAPSKSECDASVF